MSHTVRVSIHSADMSYLGKSIVLDPAINDRDRLRGAEEQLHGAVLGQLFGKFRPALGASHHILDPLVEVAVRSRALEVSQQRVRGLETERAWILLHLGKHEPRDANTGMRGRPRAVAAGGGDTQPNSEASLFAQADASKCAAILFINTCEPLVHNHGDTVRSVPLQDHLGEVLRPALAHDLLVKALRSAYSYCAKVAYHGIKDCALRLKLFL